jgi:hypothetical protein
MMPDSPAPRIVEVPPVETRPVSPVRDVTVRLTADAQQVDVKLTDRGGELHVAVHSADPLLNTDLRASVHDLIGGLEKSGFRAEAWHSGDSPHHSADATSGPVRGAGEPSQHQSGADPRQQGRNAYGPEYTLSRRNRAAAGSNAEWMQQISALTGAEREN